MPRNFFTLTDGKTSRSSFNTLINFYEAVSSISAYAKYVYIKTKSGGCFFAPTQIIGHNFDPSNGICFCSYEAVLEPDFLSGEVITQVGFAPFALNDYIVNAASFNFLKQAGEKLDICGTIFLDKTETGARFLSGENIIIKALLGAESFPRSEFTLAIGENLLPSSALHRDNQNFNEVKAVAPQFKNNQISFSANFSGEVKEAVLLHKNIPVMRARPESASALTINTVNAQNKGYADLSEDFITHLSNIAVNSTPIYDYFLSSPPDSLFYLNRTDFLAGPNSYLIGCINNLNSFSLNDNGRITLLKNQNGKFMPYKWFKGSGVRVCQNGAAVIFKENTVLWQDGVERELNIAAGEKNEAVELNGFYLIACYRQGRCELNYVDNNYRVSTLTSQYTINGGVEFIRISDYAIAVFAEGQPVKVYTPLDEDSAMTDWLSQIQGTVFSNLSLNPVFGGGRLLFYNREFRKTYYINFMDTVLKQFNKEGRVWGDFFVSFKNGKSAISKADNTDDVLAEAEGEIVQLITQRDCVYMLMGDGSLLTYLTCSKKTRLYSARINAGSFLSYTARYLAYSPGTAGITINITEN